ncbi:MAG: leucine-rich repeat domain-containing protein [Tannerellaceae bacterium]|jgi:hypothetical protein|nr:leucine-rich repeat domain-containing protein [Tannerellaceae bacterium]
MKRFYRSLSTMALIAGTALIAPFGVAEGQQVSDFLPHQYKDANQNAAGRSFWFPALYGGETDALSSLETVYISSASDATPVEAASFEWRNAEDLLFNAKSDDVDEVYPKATTEAGDDVEKIEPTSLFSYHFNITYPAGPGAKDLGEVTLTGFEATAGLLADYHLFSVPEFVWVEKPKGTPAGEGKYFVYRVTGINPDVLSSVAKIEGRDTLYNKFYFIGDGEVSRHDADANLSGSWSRRTATVIKSLDAISFTPSVPVSVTGEPVNFYGILNKDAEVRIRPTRFATEGATGEAAGSAMFDGFVVGAREIATQLGFGLSGDPRDKSLSKADFTRLAGFFNTAGVGALAHHTNPSFDYKSTSLTLHLKGANGAIDGDNSDVVPFNVTIEANAFTAPGLADRFSSIYFESGLAGDLGAAGFSYLTPYADVEALALLTTEPEKTYAARGGRYNPGFQTISFVGKSGTGPYTAKTGKDQPLSTGVTFTGASLFAGKDIETLQLPGYLTEIGNEWFADAHIDVLQGTLDKVTSIGVSAFEQSFIKNYELIFNTADVVFKQISEEEAFESDGVAGYVRPLALDSKSAKAVVNIGNRAFYNLTIPDAGSITKDFKYVTTIGDSAFANTKGDLSVTDFAYLESVGNGAFANDTLVVNTVGADIIKHVLGGPASGLENTVVVPSDSFLTTLPAKLFDGVKKIKAGAEEIKTPGFYFSGKAVPSTDIHEEAFYNAIVYVPYVHFEAWKSILKTSVVKAYGIPDKKTGGAVRLFNTDNGAAFGLSADSSYYAVSYGQSDYTLKLDFTNAVNKGAAYYAISGPAAAAPFGILSKEVEIPTDIKGRGILLPFPELPAGLYTIFTGDVTGKQLDTTLVYVIPTNLSEVRIDTINLSYIGEENIKTFLKNISVKDIAVYESSYSDATLTLTDADARLFPIKDVKIKVDSTSTIATLRGTGNYEGAADIYLTYHPFDISTAEISLSDVDFTGAQKSYPFEGKVTAVSEGFTVDITPDVSVVEYTAPSTVTIFPVAVTVKAKSESENVTGQQKSSYNVVAPWSKLAEYPYDQSVNKTVTFNGLPYDISDIVSLLFLSESDYTIVAIPTVEATYEYVKDLGTYSSDPLSVPGTYDIYIIPAGDRIAEYANKKNALLAGTVKYEPLTLASLKDAFTVSLSGLSYSLSIDEEGYAGAYSAVLKPDATAFTVTIDAAAAATIEGLSGNTFEIAIPTELPTSLRFEAFNGEQYVAFPHKSLYVNQSYDLSSHLKANKGAKLDFLGDIVWTVSGKEGKIWVSDKGVVTAGPTDWEGVSVVATVKGTGVSTSISVSVLLAGETIPTSVAAASSATRSIGYADGKLLLKGYAGTTATLYRLNGVVAGRFKVTSPEAAYGIALSKGFYLVKVGTTAVKIVVR